MSRQRGGEPQALKLLDALRAQSGGLLSHDGALAAIGDGAKRASVQHLRNLVGSLRAEGHRIDTVRGRGFVLRPEPAAPPPAAPAAPRKRAAASKPGSGESRPDRVLRRLRAAAGGVVSAEALARAAYPEEAVDEAFARRAAGNAVHHLRQYGHDVRGGGVGGYWLVEAVWEAEAKRPVPERRRCTGPCRQVFKPAWDTNFICASCSGRDSYGFDDYGLCVP